MYNRVREYRQRRGLTATELATLTGVSVSLIYQIETGAKDPSLRVALKLARHLRCRIDDLFQDAPASKASAAGGDARRPPAEEHSS